MEIQELFTRLRENEKTAERFYKVESKIISILDFKDFFEVLLYEIEKNFNIPLVWISLLKGCELSRLIETLSDTETLKRKSNIIDQAYFNNITGGGTDPVLANSQISTFRRLFPEKRKDLVNSIAIAPISLDGRIIGSINQGDYSKDRFQPGIDTSLLSQLALKVSLCLSNVTAHEKLKFLAFHDPLTGLLNRRVMEKSLLKEIERSKRYRSTLSVVFIDLDDFKAINDSFGHDHGDKMLKFVSNNLLKMCRQSDIVARYAGDEFILILPETKREKAAKLMKRITAFFENTPLMANGNETYGSISYGIAATVNSESSSCDLSIIKDADRELYKKKKKLHSK